MTYKVDEILDSWFGESPDCSEQEEKRIKYLYAPLRKMEEELKRLRQEASDRSWRENPDRSGGQFTQDEIDNAGAWR
jgi:hypothetical protein